MASKGKKLGIAADLFKQDFDGNIKKIPLSQIKASESQPRKDRDIKIKELSLSLQQDGLLQPIVVTKDGIKYKIIAGERRFRAATMAKWADIECRILDKNTEDTFRLAVIENLQREDLNPIEESKAFFKLKKSLDYTDQQLAEILGKSRNYINEILSITEIPANLQEEAASAGISSKNMLIQLAQAHKNKSGREFITQLKLGQITNVKKAKAFNKTIKDVKAKRKPSITEPYNKTRDQQEKCEFKIQKASETPAGVTVEILLPGLSRATPDAIKSYLTKSLS